MSMRRLLLLTVAVGTVVAGCGHGTRTAPTPLTATPQMLDSLWSVALDYYHRHKWNKAGVELDRLLLELPVGDRRNLLGRLYLGDTYMHQGSSLEAVQQYQRLSDEYPSDSLAPVALLHAGDAYLRLWRKPDLDPTYGTSAEAAYQEVVVRYPDAPAADTARQRLTDVENRFAQRQYEEAHFYLKYNAYESAILYLKDLVATWPRSPVAPKAVDGLIEAYHKLDYPDDVREMCNYFRSHWPNVKPNGDCPSTPGPTSPGASP
jgi:outer membrane protein assembly factor BamD